jgi:hypothetical protein
MTSRQILGWGCVLVFAGIVIAHLAGTSTTAQPSQPSASATAQKFCQGINKDKDMYCEVILPASRIVVWVKTVQGDELNIDLTYPVMQNLCDRFRQTKYPEMAGWQNIFYGMKKDTRPLSVCSWNS